MLKPCASALIEQHDLIALDLDGVVYIGRNAVDHAVSALAAATGSGVRLAYLTNNAARPPGVVAEHLRSLGIAATDEDVVNSAQAAARLLSRDFEPGSAIYLIGGSGLVEALGEHGLRAVTTEADAPVAVVQGYGPDMPWRQVVLGAVLVCSGLPWVATNTDMTIPIAAGIGPGNGTLVDLISRFAERSPVVAGKPEPALFDETMIRTGAERPLMVGDRLDTDISGAVRAGWPSLLVMTGVTGVAELVAAPPSSRPTFISADLRGLMRRQDVPQPSGSGFTLGGWTSAVDDAGHLAVTGEGTVDDWWRCVAVAGWQHLDDTGRPACTDGLVAVDS